MENTMKVSNLWNFLLHLLNDNTGSVSLTGTGSDATGSTGDADGDSGLSTEPTSGQSAGVDESSDSGSAVSEGTPELSGLSEDLRDDPSLKVFMDEKGNVSLEKLAKSYVHAQRKMGEKGVRLPDNRSTDEEWANFYNMVRPSELEKYEVKNSLEEGTALDENLFNGFKATAHKAGLSQKQAQNLLDWFNGVSSESQQELASQRQDAYDKEVKGLKEDWGDAFDRQMALATRAVKEFADDDTIQYLKESGLDGNVKLIRLFSKIGGGLLEDKFDQEAHGTFGTTKEEAQKKMAVVYGDQGHPYWDNMHPSHKHAVEEMQKLMKIVEG